MDAAVRTMRKGFQSAAHFWRASAALMAVAGALFGGRSIPSSFAADGAAAAPMKQMPAVSAVADAGRKPQIDMPKSTPASRPAAASQNDAGASRRLEGVVFSGSYESIADVKGRMQRLLAEMNWTAGQVLTHESPDGKQVAYTLNSPAGDTSTLSLTARAELGLAREAISYLDRHGQEKTLSLVSQKEILAAMLQRGRAFAFSGENCSVEKLKEQLALRQNIVYWGSRADWAFPEDKTYRYNTGEYWQEMLGDDWTLKPGLRPSAAIADAFTGKFDYQIGCTSACRFIVAHGIFDYFVRVRPDPAAIARIEQTLDARRPFVKMTPTVDRDGTFRAEGLLVDRQFNVPSDHWAPGDWGWIKNLDAKSAEELGSEGCNIIYAGGGYFVNYYPERPPKTLDESIKRVYGWQFGIEEGDLHVAPELAKQLRQDPRSGGMLRDVRDVPKFFGAASPARPGA